MNFAGANSVTIPLNSSVPFNTGTVITIEQVGAGQTEVLAASGVTRQATVGFKSIGQYAMMQCIKVGTNTWTVIGGQSL
jgi:hypothetical protein